MVKPVYNAPSAWFIWSAIMTGVAAVFTFAWRFNTGAHMDGKPKTDARWFAGGTRTLVADETASWWCYRPRFVRMVMRWVLSIMALLVAYTAALMVIVGDPEKLLRLVIVIASITAIVWGYWRYKTRDKRRVRKFYTEPLGLHIAPYLGWPTTAPLRKWLHVSEHLEGLAAPPARKMRKIERLAREWYGVKIEPVLLWLPDQVIRLRDHATDKLRGGEEKQEKNKFLRQIWDLFALEEEELPPCIEVRAARHHHISLADKDQVRELVSTKLSAGTLAVDWQQTGTHEKGIFTTVKSPPSRVGYDVVKAEIEKIKEDESNKFFVGLDSEFKPYYVDLETDSPHIAVSAGTGAGKSVFAMIIAIQVLRRGGRVIVLDLKGSHLWAKDLPGVTYCRKVEEMHDTLMDVGSIAIRRNDEAFDRVDPDAENQGEPINASWPRYFLIFEEMNATVKKMKSHWNKVRESDDEKESPAVAAFHEIMFMGRSALVNLFGVAQMLTAQAVGGPEARENFGIRCLARHTANAWKMLVPEVRMRKASKVRGRWQIVVAGEATEVQSGFVEIGEARRLVREGLEERRVAQSRTLETTGPVQASLAHSGASEGGSGQASGALEVEDPLSAEVTLEEAILEGYINSPTVGAARKSLNRAQLVDPGCIESVGKAGNAKLYRVADLIEVFTSVTMSTEEGRKAS